MIHTATAGRGTEGRTITGVLTTNTEATVTAPANSFEEEDAGRPITGAGIPAATTILSVQSDTAATLSAAATASGTISAAAGGAAGEAMGFRGWAPETDAESESYSVAGFIAGAIPPDRLADGVTQRAQRHRG